MKTNILIIIMTAFMVEFLIGAFQTWEYCVDHDIPVPWQVWAFGGVSALWFYLLYKMPKRRKEIDDLVRRLTEE